VEGLVLDFLAAIGLLDAPVHVDPVQQRPALESVEAALVQEALFVGQTDQDFADLV